MTRPTKKQWLTLALYALLPAAVLVIGIVGGDTWYIIATSVVAVVYLLLLNDGFRVAYLLCAVFGFAYGAVSFVTKLYAGAVFHVCVLAPTGIYRFFASKKAEEQRIRSLSPVQWALCFAFVLALTLGLFFLLRAIKDSQPLLDALTLSFSVVTVILMSRNFRELWIFNLFSSVLYVVIWTVEFIASGNGLAVVALQSIVSLINLRGMLLWRKRPEEEKQEA